MHHDKVALALDRASARTYDQDGHLHVARTPISKANVCPYYGYEIPDFEALGLSADRTYQLLRDPDELARAASTFAGKPLLNIHRALSADDHDHEVVAGAVQNPVFEPPYLKADLSVWDGDSIRDVESDVQRELSSAYRFRADMTAGTYEGVRYDGVMRDIVGNHVALVREGRAGPDVLVGDSKIDSNRNGKIIMTKTVLTRKAALVQGAVIARVLPKLAKDAKVDFTPAFASITAANYSASKPGIKTALDAAVKGKLAKDADISDVTDLLDALEEMTPEEVDTAKEQAADESDEEKKAREAKEAKEKADKEAEAKDKAAKDKKAMDGMVTKAAMDEAITAAVAGASKIATDAALKQAKDLREAERIVRPWVGDIVAQDSAEAVYRTALTSLGVAGADKLHVEALRPVLEAQPLPGETARTKKIDLAQDAATAKGFGDRYPTAGRIGFVA